MPFFSKPGGFQQLSTATPQQQSLHPSIVSQTMQALQGLQNPYAGFQPIANQAMQRFENQTLPSLAERFTGLSRSGGGALSSPAFAAQSEGARNELNTNLAALQSQYGLQQQGQHQNLLNLLLGYANQPQFQNAWRPGEEGLFDKLAGPAVQLGSAYLSGGLLNSYNKPQQSQQQPSFMPMMQNSMFPQNNQGFGNPSFFNSNLSRPLNFGGF